MSTILANQRELYFERGGPTPEGEPLLGSADIQSLADLGGSFEFIRAMWIVPFNQRSILQLAIITALPGMRLLLLVMPIEKVPDALGRALLKRECNFAADAASGWELMAIHHPGVVRASGLTGVVAMYGFRPIKSQELVPLRLTTVSTLELSPKKVQ